MCRISLHVPPFKKKNGFSRRLSLATNITKKTYSYQNLDSFSDNNNNNKKLLTYC